MRWVLCSCLSLGGAFAAWGQAPAATAPVQLSPGAAYDQALRPLEIVRRSMANWSDSEVGAFAVAIKNAQAACVARKPDEFAGDDLIAYAKLCSLGQQWGPMGAAAARYIDSNDEKKPQLNMAYGYKVESELHAKDLDGIVGMEVAMLAGVPYDGIVDSVTNEVMGYLELAYTDEALGLMQNREWHLIEALKSDKPLVPKHTLYEDGLAYAALEQYAGDPASAAARVAELDLALGTSLPPDEAIPVETARRRYALLGKPLPGIDFELSLADVREKPHINPDYGSATALLLFPEWCAQCVRTAPEIWDAMGRLGGKEIRVYGLLAAALPDKAALLKAQMKPMGPVPADAPPKPVAEQLLHNPVLVVPPETLKRFAAEDFPFLVVVDHAGIVRFAAPAPEAVLAEGNMLDQVTLHMAETWPKAAAKSVPILR